MLLINTDSLVMVTAFSAFNKYLPTHKYFQHHVCYKTKFDLYLCTYTYNICFFDYFI